MYIIDTNIFITPYRNYYPFGFGLEFWNFLVKKAEEGEVCSIDKVFDELKDSDDELSKWVTKCFQKYFKSCDNVPVIETYREIIKWVDSQSQYKPEAKNEFMLYSNADAWIIAYAKANGLKVVTLESLSKNQKNRVPIPNVCEAFQIGYLNIYDFLKITGFKFCEENN